MPSFVKFLAHGVFDTLVGLCLLVAAFVLWCVTGSLLYPDPCATIYGRCIDDEVSLTTVFLIWYSRTLLFTGIFMACSIGAYVREFCTSDDVDVKQKTA